MFASLEQEDIDSLVPNLPMTSILLDKKKAVIAWNYAAEQFFGRYSNKIINRLNIIDLLENCDVASVYELALKGEKISNKDITIQTKNGTLINLCLWATPAFKKGKIIGCIMILQDITDIKENEENFHEVKRQLNVSEMKYRSLFEHCDNLVSILDANGIIPFQSQCLEKKDYKTMDVFNKLALYDHLTGLPNKNMFKIKIEEELERAKSNKQNLALMHLDIDRFKQINELLGIDVGDKLLVQISKRINIVIGKSGFAARKFGDEFFIIQKSVNEEGIDKLAIDVINIFDYPFFCNTEEVYLTASMGISVFPNAGETSTSLIKNAAAALQVAKQNGNNNYQYYTSKVNLRSYKSFMLQNDLRRALKNKEFFLHFQPLVDLKTSRIIGTETLIRWNHPEWGIVSPTEFIPIAEETGLIVPIGDWVMEAACLQNKKWIESGMPPITLSINISPFQFNDPNLYNKIKSIIEKVNIDPSYLMVEITENSLIREEANVLATVNKLKKLGVRIAIDDFGTGYSSLAYLKKFKFDCLKIDKSFIHELSVDVISKEIASAIIKLGKKLSMNIVAEGIETIEQYKIVKDLCCDYVQGYYLYRPITSEDFQRLLAKDKIDYEENNESVGISK